MWRVSHWIVNGIFLLPVGVLLCLAIWSDAGGLMALWGQGMSLYWLHSLVLVCGTVTLSVLIGLPAAWVMARYHFTGKRGVAWALCLPLAMPAFLIAGFYTDVLSAGGLLHEVLGAVLDDGNGQGRRLVGACVVMALACYPYIYLPVRHALETQPAHWHQAARLLKLTPRQIFWRLSFPLVRPIMITGAVLVAVETLNDYVTASLLSLPTLTTALIDNGVVQGNAQAVAQWTMALLPFLVLLTWLGLRARQRQWQSVLPGDTPVPMRLHMTRGKARCVVLAGWGLAMLAMGLPLGRLLYWGGLHLRDGWNAALLWATLHSLAVAALATLVLCLVAVPFLLTIRRAGLMAGRSAFLLSQLSYVIPAAALAMGIAVPLIAVDNGLSVLAGQLGSAFSTPLFSSVWLIMVVVYCLKFSRFMLEPLSEHMVRISPILDQVSQQRGLSTWQRWSQVYFPQLKPSMLMGAMIVFFEGLKELNGAFLFHALGVETLPTYVFRFASDKQLEWSAVPALWLVVVGIVPMLWFQRVWKGNNP